MSDLTYKKLLSGDTDVPKLTALYQLPEITRYISISDNYFHYVTATPNVYFYKAYKNGELIGTVHLENKESTLFMSLIVFPEFKRRGFGKKIVSDIQNDIFDLGYDRIEIAIDRENIPSRKLFEGAGFIRTSKDDEILCYIYEK